MLATAVKIPLLIFAAYHVVAGASVLGPRRWLQLFGGNVYNLIIPNTYEPRYQLTLKFLGAMAWGLAGLTLVIALEGDLRTQAFGMIVYGLLFILRGSLRLLMQKELFDAYQLTPQRNRINFIFNFLLGIATISTGIVAL